MAQTRPYSREWFEELRRLLGVNACRQLGFYALPDDFVLSVVIPVYNERNTIRELVGRVAAVPVRKELVLVDDCSTDGSWDVMSQLPSEFTSADTTFVLERHALNSGKGRALRTGFARASGTVIAIQDADLEYDPAELPRLIQPIIDDRADVVFGSRFLGDQPHRVLYYWHYLGNAFLTTFSNCLTNLNLTDMETCYKVFRRQALMDVLPTLKQDRFGFEPEVTAKIARRRSRVYEMSISYSGRTYTQGKKIGWKDGVQAIWCIVRYGIAD